MFIATLIALALPFAGADTPADDARPTPSFVPGDSAAAIEANAAIDRVLNAHGDLYDGIVALNRIRAASPVGLRDTLDQFRATFASIAGNYREAARIDPIGGRCDRPGSPPSGTFVESPAVPRIVERARARRAVVINESHARPVTRALVFELLGPLRGSGFTHFAVEALSTETTDTRCANGFLSACDVQLSGRVRDAGTIGVYTREPVMAELLREARALGFQLVAYDDYDAATVDERERRQAQRIARVLLHDTRAKVLVLAGFDHALESGGRMAGYLADQSRIDPLTIDQVDCLDTPSSSRPVVLASPDGAWWSSRPGGFDVAVLTSRSYADSLAWLTLGGARIAVTLPGDICGRDATRVEAWPLGRDTSEVPSDRFVRDGRRACRPLYLRPGDYRLRIDRERGSTAWRSLHVTASGRGTFRRAREARPDDR